MNYCTSPSPTLSRAKVESEHGLNGHLVNIGVLASWRKSGARVQRARAPATTLDLFESSLQPA